MGTNVSCLAQRCECCKRADEPVHAPPALSTALNLTPPVTPRCGVVTPREDESAPFLLPNGKREPEEQAKQMYKDAHDSIKLQVDDLREKHLLQMAAVCDQHKAVIAKYNSQVKGLEATRNALQESVDDLVVELGKANEVISELKAQTRVDDLEVELGKTSTVISELKSRTESAIDKAPKKRKSSIGKAGEVISELRARTASSVTAASDGMQAHADELEVELGKAGAVISELRARTESAQAKASIGMQAKARADELEVELAEFRAKVGASMDQGSIGMQAQARADELEAELVELRARAEMSMNNAAIGLQEQARADELEAELAELRARMEVSMDLQEQAELQDQARADELEAELLKMNEAVVDKTSNEEQAQARADHLAVVLGKAMDMISELKSRNKSALDNASRGKQAQVRADELEVELGKATEVISGLRARTESALDKASFGMQAQKRADELEVELAEFRAISEVPMDKARSERMARADELEVQLTELMGRTKSSMDKASIGMQAQARAEELEVKVVDLQARRKSAMDKAHIGMQAQARADELEIQLGIADEVISETRARMESAMDKSMRADELEVQLEKAREVISELKAISSSAVDKVSLVRQNALSAVEASTSLHNSISEGNEKGLEAAIEKIRPQIEGGEALQRRAYGRFAQIVNPIYADAVKRHRNWLRIISTVRAVVGTTDDAVGCLLAQRLFLALRDASVTGLDLEKSSPHISSQASGILFNFHVHAGGIGNSLQREIVRRAASCRKFCGFDFTDLTCCLSYTNKKETPENDFFLRRARTLIDICEVYEFTRILALLDTILHLSNTLDKDGKQLMKSMYGRTKPEETDRWILQYIKGAKLRYSPGQKFEHAAGMKLLSEEDVLSILSQLRSSTAVGTATHDGLRAIFSEWAVLMKENFGLATLPHNTQVVCLLISLDMSLEMVAKR